MDGPVELRRLAAIEEIRRLKALYCHWADRGYETAGDDARRFAELFVEDGTWAGGDGVPVAGRAAIEQHYASFRPFSFHFVTNGIVEVDGSRAGARWSVLSPSTTQDGVALWSAGTYDDAMVETADGWRFESVRFTRAFRAPYADGWAQPSS